MTVLASRLVELEGKQPAIKLVFVERRDFTAVLLLAP
jgi:hypothetical protein